MKRVDGWSFPRFLRLKPLFNLKNLNTANMFPCSRMNTMESLQFVVANFCGLLKSYWFMRISCILLYIYERKYDFIALIY